MMILAAAGLAGVIVVNHLQTERHQTGLDKEASVANALLTRKRIAEGAGIIAGNRSATALELLHAEAGEETDLDAKKIRSMEEILLDQASLDNEAEEEFLREDKKKADAFGALKQIPEPSNDDSSKVETPSAAASVSRAGIEKKSPDVEADPRHAKSELAPKITNEADMDKKGGGAPDFASTPNVDAPASSVDKPAVSSDELESGQSL
jgi:hypothetical protein